jgi:hypothetical protein
VAVILLAAALVVAAESAAVLSASLVHRPNMRQRRISPVAVFAVPYGGELHLTTASRIESGARIAAVRFVGDYARWSDGKLADLPEEDATLRVIRLLDRHGRGTGVNLGAVTGLVRVAPVGTRTYVVTSAVGNFLISRRGERWLVVSVPGD